MLVCQTGPNLDVIPLGGKDCGLEGDAKGADVKALNRLKGRYNSPVTSDFDQTVTLTAMISPGDDENRFDTKSAATVIGYVLEVQVGGKETCNCHATADDDRDTHIALALSEDGDKTQSVVAEVTPPPACCERWRGRTTGRLRHSGEISRANGSKLPGGCCLTSSTSTKRRIPIRAERRTGGPPAGRSTP